MKKELLNWAQTGIKIVRNIYPTALLLEIDTWKSEGTTLNPNELDNMRIVFSFEDTKSIIIESLAANTFDLPIIYDEPFIEDVVVKHFPIEMDLSEALKLIKKAGFEKPFSNVTLRHPMKKGHHNVLYMVGNPHEGISVSVNTTTKDVKEIDNLLTEQWFSLNVCAYGVDIIAFLDITSGEKPKDFYKFEDGSCTDTQKITSKSGFYGTEGNLEMRVNDGKDGKSGELICKAYWDSPYSGENKFYLKNVSSNYDVQITGKGNSGQRTGTLGSCSMNVIKK